MENNLIYTTRSRQDLDDIWDYISFDLQNLPSAERILNRIMDAAEQIIPSPIFSCKMLI